ncbi:MAG: Gfo/Idh/MocA family oxidoreductase [Verrucomicrobia bacterium]|nr:Gfo/Idh/MocA family oxidoreductase [Verrucomicrobiota bacterium]
MKVTRRQFLASSAAAAAAITLVPRHVLGGAKFVPPSEKVNIALVGAGGQGRVNLQALLRESDAQVIAVADPAQSFSLEEFYYKGMGGRSATREMIEKHYAPKTPNFRCTEHEDFRVMLEKEKAIDAVLCATPDHLHACVSVLAMRAGKHVYCEKPLTHNIWEARLVSRVAKETGVATQMGNIGHSSEGMRQTCEWLWAGAIGAVREVHAWVGATRWNKSLTGRPTDTPPVPAGLNWDLWLGPREPRPYHPAYVPVKWRDFWAFGTGAIGDFVCHDLDAACWALDLRDPLWIEARPGSQMDAEISPHSELVYWQFGPRGDKPPVRVTWYDGGLRPPLPDGWPDDEPLPGRGSLFFGDKGVLLSSFSAKPRLIPDEKNDTYKAPPKTIPRSKGHHRDWLDACKGGAPASSHFDYAARLTEMLLQGVLSLRTGKRINWDAANMKARNLPAADAIIKESYRKEWELA